MSVIDIAPEKSEQKVCTKPSGSYDTECDLFRLLKPFITTQKPGQKERNALQYLKIIGYMKRQMLIVIPEYALQKYISMK